MGEGTLPRLDGLSDEELSALWFHTAATLQRRGLKLWHVGDTEILVAATLGVSALRAMLSAATTCSYATAHGYR